MSVNSANRSFYALVGLAGIPYLALGLVGCGLVPYIAYRLSVDGSGVLTGEGQDLRPALLFFAIVGGGTVAALWSILHQWRATQALIAHVQRSRDPTPDMVKAAAGRAKLGGRVDVVSGTEPFCFTYGMSAPRVAVSTALADRLTVDELVAVLAHERYHLRTRDPLKVVVGRALSRAYFFLPVLSSLQQRYLAGRELAADRRALRQTGRPALVSALVKAASGPHWSELGAAAAIAGDEHLELRVHQLESGSEPPLPVLPRPALGISVAGLALLVISLVATIVAIGGPTRLMDGAGMDMGSWSPPAAVAVVGAVVCMGLWVAGGWFVVRRWNRRQSFGQAERENPGA